MTGQNRPVIASLRAKLLAITALVVMVMGAMVYFPAIASFRLNFLEERAKSSQIAALATEETQDNRLSPQLEQELLRTAGVIGVIVGRSDFTLILGADIMPEEANANFDLRSATLGGLVADALDTLNFEGERIIRVISDGQTTESRFVEITMDEVVLYDALNAYSNNIMIVAVIVSLVTGSLVYLALHLMLVRPMNRVRRAIATFSAKPEQVVPALANSTRRDEIGIVERELARMQEELRQALQQKNRLAELGEAVAKINHDLRNILATAKLASDSLARNEDPRVQKTASRLISAVGRAVALCERTMKHGKAAEPAPEPRAINLKSVARDVGETLGLGDHNTFTFEMDFPDDLTVFADEAQLHRVILNLCRNALQAQGNNGRITIGAEVGADGFVYVRIADAGPGIPSDMLPNLFKAFASSGRKGGTGLGLAIARDIILAHGGHIGLERTGPEGTIFLVCLPKAPDQ